MGRRMPERRQPRSGLNPRGPDANGGPQRFIRKWLTFDEARPMRIRRLWMLIATVMALLTACALLAWFGNQRMSP
jgi:hypothetical protein